MVGFAKLRQRGRSNRGRAAMNMFGNGPWERGGGIPDSDSLSTRPFVGGVWGPRYRTGHRPTEAAGSGFMMGEEGWFWQIQGRLTVRSTAQEELL